MSFDTQARGNEARLAEGSSVPRVSIIVPDYNRPEYLRQALESVVNQTYSDWELVVVDDASAHGEISEVAAEFVAADPGRITGLRLEQNLGVAGARLAGMELTRGGELVTLLDSDDCLREDYLERCVGLYDEGVAAGKRIGIVACNARILEPAGLADETFADRFGWVDPLDFDSMIRHNRILSRAVFSRAAYDEVGGLDTSCLCWDDYDLWMRIMEAGYAVTATRETIVDYRCHPDSMSMNQCYFYEAGVATYTRMLERGRLTPRQRRVAKARRRHYRALRERGRVREALAQRRPLKVAALGLHAAPYGLVALIQDRSRWGEWARDAGRMTRRALSRRPTGDGL